MFSIPLWGTLLLSLWIYALWSRRKFYQLALKVPGPMGYPFIGIVHKLWNKAFLTFASGEIQKWGSIWLTWFGPVPMLIVSDPKTAQDIITCPHAMNKSNMTYDVLNDIMGNGLVLIGDSLWSKHRKAFNPAFNHHVLLSFLPIYNDETGSLLQELDALVGKGEKDLFSMFKGFTTKIAIQTVMGRDVLKEKNYQNNSMVENYDCLFETGSKLAVSPWLNNKLLKNLSGIERTLADANSSIRKVIEKLVERKLDADAISGEHAVASEHNIVLKLALDQFRKGGFSYQDIIDESNTFVIAAFESTALTIGYTLMTLAMYPEYQEKVFAEIKSVFPITGNFDVTYEASQKLEYLDMVLNETMRLMPPFPLIARQISEDLKLSNGILLPKGLQIFINIFHMHRNKDIWGPQADIFNPENCSPQNLESKHPYAFMPFSKGKRNCIGWKYAMISLKVTLARVLRNYKFKTSFRVEDLVIESYFSLKFKNVPSLELERRT